MPNDIKTTDAQPGSLHPAGSAALVKAEIAILKEKWSKRWWNDRPNNGDLQELIALIDKLSAVTDSIQKQMPPNDQAER